MTTYAESSCGFLPLHLYEGADLERARNIVHAINLFALDGMGIGVDRARPDVIADLSLQDMLDAVRTVERWNARPKMMGVGYSQSMVPDDRLTAAVYTLIHFHDQHAIGDADGDHIPVQFTAQHWGDKVVHFLLVGARPKPDAMDEDDDEEPA